MSLCHIPSASVDRSVFTCNGSRLPTAQSEWNNEAEPLTLWLEAAPRWKVQPAFIQVPEPPWPIAVRSLEFEYQASEDAAALEFVGWPYSLSVSHRWPLSLSAAGLGAQPCGPVPTASTASSPVKLPVFKGSLDTSSGQHIF